MVGSNVRKSLLVVMVLGVVLLAWPVCAGADDVPNLNEYSIPGPAAAEGSVQALALTSGVLVGNYGLERAVVIGSGDQHYPAIYGSYIAYEEGTGGAAADVKLYDRRSNTAITINTAGTRAWRPRIWGNRVVWSDDRNGAWDIYWYDIAKKKEYRLTTSAADQLWPEINGDKVVWQDFRHGKWEIYLYDFVAKRETRITSDAFIQYNPRISGNRIIWHDYRNGNWDIYWYDIAKKKEYRLTDSPLHEYGADVSGTKAAWTRESAAGDEEVVLAAYFDASVVATGFVGSSGSDLTRPRLYGNTLLYQGDSTGMSQVYVFRLGQPGVERLTDSAGHAFEPQMWGDTVTWIDTRGGTRDIYAAAVPSPKLSVSAPGYVSYNTTTTVTGTLKNWDGSVLARRAVKVQYLAYANRGQFWWNDINVTTTSKGTFSAKVPPQTGRFWVRAYYGGDADAYKQLSSQKTVLPKVSLARPSGPKSISRTKTFKATGALRPQHTAGTKPVRIQCYRKESGRWKLRKTYTASVADYSTYSKYSATVKLPYAGSWRVRAYYPTSGTNYKSYSKYRYITSK